MNLRLLFAGLLVALGLGAAAFWLRRTAAAESPLALPTPTAPAVAGDVRVDGLPAPVEKATAASRTAPVAEPAPPVLPEVAVEPLLELNMVVAAGAAATSVDEVRAPVDELLGGKHFDHDAAQRAQILRSIQAVLDRQRSPESIDKHLRLSPEAISAFEIEAAWLKEHPQK